jgi:hypothetical protein
MRITVGQQAQRMNGPIQFARWNAGHREWANLACDVGWCQQIRRYHSE